MVLLALVKGGAGRILTARAAEVKARLVGGSEDGALDEGVGAI